MKGIAQETRDTARDAAQAAGLPIGAWIDNAILKAARGELPGVPGPGSAAATPADISAHAETGPAESPPTPEPAGIEAQEETRKTVGASEASEVVSFEPVAHSNTEVAAESPGEEKPPEAAPLFAGPEDRYDADPPTLASPRPLRAPEPVRQRPGIIRYIAVAAILVALAGGVAWIFVAGEESARTGTPGPVAERVPPAAAPDGSGTGDPARETTGASRPESTSSVSPQDPVARLIERATAGDPAAQHDLGMLHLSGNGVKRDPAEAARWLERAAKEGQPNAQFNLGVMYRDGNGVKEDQQVAVFWFQSAAEQGFARAQHNLAIAYARGSGAPKSEQQAVNWFTRAAESGLADSQYSLGLIYDRGLGDVKPDMAKAREWYAKAAAQGDIRSAERIKMLDNLLATRTPAATPATDSPAADDRPLGRNEIRELQRLLNSLDFDAGPADGQIGPKTTSAITLYQKFAGFEPDGKATRELIIDLRAVARDVPNRR